MPPWMKLILMGSLMDEAGDAGKGGAGGTPAGGDGKPAPAAAAPDVAALLARIEQLEKDRKAPSKPGDEGDDSDLAAKAAKARKASEASGDLTKRLETAVKFTMSAPGWLKQNESLLPKTIPGIFEAAAKENYGSEMEKADAIKVGIVSEFFALQENLDLLTESQKSQLEDFKKLTKTDRQERVKSIFDGVFEPTFEMMKRVKRAEQVQKGLGNPTDAQQAYKLKMEKLSKKQYLGEK